MLKLNKLFLLTLIFKSTLFCSSDTKKVNLRDIKNVTLKLISIELKSPNSDSSIELKRQIKLNMTKVFNQIDIDEVDNDLIKKNICKYIKKYEQLKLFLESFFASRNFRSVILDTSISSIKELESYLIRSFCPDFYLQESNYEN